MEDVKGVPETYATAAVTGKLVGHHTDVLTTAGMIGQRHAIAMRTWRLLDALDSSEYVETLTAYKGLIRQQAERQKVNVSGQDIDKSARLFLSYVIAPICPTCVGRGASLIGDTKGGRGVLGDSCKTCGGTGKRNLRRDASELGEVLADLVLWLNGEVLSQSIEAEMAYRRKRRNG